MAGADPDAENLTIGDQLADLAEPEPQALGDVGNREPLAHQLFEARKIIIDGWVRSVVVRHGSRVPWSRRGEHHHITPQITASSPEAGPPDRRPLVRRQFRVSFT